MHTTHELQMVRTAESELEEWACPACGRRILLRWPPRYVKHVLDQGDEEACHIARVADEVPDHGADHGTGPGGDAAGGGAGSGQFRGNRRWLRETGAAALRPPPSGLSAAGPA